ncbi:hypothetical protein DNTS_003722 [Danionella cerebrum]|uniref:Uncharacterized protein n=1 Tax=Danionella cerebrum TaxID=2873325 RepID=A0A553RDK7_9TELE|nr:hypothetical protein DNTS_003722 [Danionella translucida]
MGVVLGTFSMHTKQVSYRTDTVVNQKHMWEHVFTAARKSIKTPTLHVHKDTYKHTLTWDLENDWSQEDYEFWAERQKACLKSLLKSPGDAELAVRLELCQLWQSALTDCN